MITGGEMIKDFTKSKEQALINYYAYTFRKQYHGLILPYRKLTLRLTTYLVMQQMGLDDKRICELLNITDSTVRNYRHRLRNPELPLNRLVVEKALGGKLLVFGAGAAVASSGILTFIS